MKGKDGKPLRQMAGEWTRSNSRLSHGFRNQSVGKCRGCGNEFEKPRGLVLQYCSHACVQKAVRARKMGWTAHNRHKHKARKERKEWRSAT